MSLVAGEKAPDFCLKDRHGQEIKLSLQESEFTVIYFYPKDSTPGCTIEAREFSKALPKFKLQNVAVIGISGGDEKSKEKFCKRFGLKLTLLSDSDFSVAKSFGAYGQKKFMGRTFNGILRKTFIVDRSGRVVKIFDTVKPFGHAAEVLAIVKAL